VNIGFGEMRGVPRSGPTAEAQCIAETTQSAVSA
jgi:hypothetical protein